jgi:hypothetical protein
LVEKLKKQEYNTFIRFISNKLIPN